jgi:hypothetical protein
MQPMHLFSVSVCEISLRSHYEFELLTCLLVGILCLFGGPIANRIGLRWTLMLGAVGYPLYSYVPRDGNMKWVYIDTDS